MPTYVYLVPLGTFGEKFMLYKEAERLIEVKIWKEVVSDVLV